MSIEVMKQALEALGIEREWQDGPVPHLDAAIAALRAAIERAEKRQWVWLTDDEISEARDTAAVEFRKNQYRVRGQMFMPSDSLEWWLARAVETKLKEKNA
jgi:hypothetical protein